ncbi:MAG TPA: DUF1501 domain-containing protein [Verrucomicrobiales bacterium]|nr:DUF1501 domain-containing protein [Verrucomicrobiales bacterium]
MKSSLHHVDEISRRSFVERLAQAAFGLSVLPFLPGQSSGAAEAKPTEPAAAAGPGFGKAKDVIMLQLSGGLSQIDSFDPKTGPSKGPGDAIDTNAGFQVTSFLPEIAKVADKICVIRSMTAKVGVHESARYLMRTGFEKRGTIVHPTLGAWAQHYLGASHQTLPSSVCVNRPSNHGNGFFPASLSPLPILDPNDGLNNAKSPVNDSTAGKRLALLNELDQSFTGKVKDDSVNAYSDFYQSTLRLMKGKDLEVFDLGRESADLRAKYGQNRFGQGCLLARRLVEGGVRFIEVESGGWDMHKDIEGGMEDRGKEFDTAFAALISDLESRGLLDSTMVVVATEFGRKPSFDGSGRGHHPKVFSCVLAGGGAKRGLVYGSSDKTGGEPESNPVTVGDLHATVGWACGLPIDKPVMSPSGRPFTIGNKGKPVSGIFA